MTCTQCGHQQAQGKFCGKCGAVLQTTETASTTAAVTQTATTQAAPIQTAAVESPYVNKAKETSKGFVEYIKKYIKSPASVLHTSATEFKNGLILLILTTVILALSLASLVHSFVSTLFEGLNEFSGFFGAAETGISSPSFTSFLFPGILYLAIPVALITGLLFAAQKVFSTGRPIQQIVAYYGTLLFPTVFLSLISLVLGFLNANTYSIVALAVAIIFALVITPVYLTATLLNKNSMRTDGYYGTAIFTIVAFLVLGVYANYLVDSAFGGVMDQINELRDFGGLF
ncbi:hypothetical protein JMA_28890 [Jeotgalibacillus malaysiensis]|uniref:Yip1 domain-containing protein n=1 Tax=Jeotgalibacillus malaysiensis TaxID=1508404 RepID=A0A0B5AQ24_9BACL|nr:zinc ribbon domain-containing protein [Jeotgalibacillus malaysiensis]AJD92206.1 hypothetical protein JMA_28890 [Jeotgalibacillus malaysiensis]